LQEQWQKEFGYLEEQIELLHGMVCQNEVSLDLREQLTELSEHANKLEKLVHSVIFQQKNIQASELLVKISNYFIEEAEKKSLPIAISYFGSGRIGIPMVGQLMPAIIFSIKASIDNFLQNDWLNTRIKNNLFPTCSIYFELKATDNAVSFRMIDDGFGFTNGKKAVRESVAHYAGWALFHSYTSYGGGLEIKLPIPKARADSLIFSYGPHRFAVPFSSVKKSSFYMKRLELLEENGSFFVSIESDLVRLCTIDPVMGLQFLSAEKSTIPDDFYVTLIGVADFQVAILTLEEPLQKSLRITNENEWIEEDSWFQYLGLYADQNISLALPYIDGNALANFYKAYWK